MYKDSYVNNLLTNLYNKMHFRKNNMFILAKLQVRKYAMKID
jgi:hypothetical protein